MVRRSASRAPVHAIVAVLTLLGAPAAAEAYDRQVTFDIGAGWGVAPALADGLDADPLVIPRNGPLTALTGVLPLQFLAYEIAVLKGINPDVPRNLAKAVTVD